jgi:leucyl-tRNA synthetase
MVHGKTYTDPTTGRFLKPAEIDLVTDPAVPKFVLQSGERISASVSYEKMSKSKHNGVDPGTCIRRNGADATRAHILFSAPVSEVLEWDETRIVGVQRWFGRVWRFVMETRREFDRLPTTQTRSPAPSKRVSSTIADGDGHQAAVTPFDHQIPHSSTTAADHHLWATLQSTIRDITTSLEGVHSLNTVVSSLMELSNVIISTRHNPNTSNTSLTTVYHALSTLLRLLAPVAPAFASECWEALHLNRKQEVRTTDVLLMPWPTLSSPTTFSSAIPTELTTAVQINGKLRFVTTLSPGPPEQLEDEALKAWLVGRLGEAEGGRKWLVGKGEAKRVVVVGRGKVVNFVF